jgi:hypothetical protein
MVELDIPIVVVFGKVRRLGRQDTKKQIKIGLARAVALSMAFQATSIDH